MLAIDCRYFVELQVVCEPEAVVAAADTAADTVAAVVVDDGHAGCVGVAVVAADAEDEP